GPAAPKRPLQPRRTHAPTQHIEQAAPHQIARVTELVRLAGALHLVRSDLLDHRARLLPGRAAQIQGAAQEQNGRRHEHESHRVSSPRLGSDAQRHDLIERREMRWHKMKAAEGTPPPLLFATIPVYRYG